MGAVQAAAGGEASLYGLLAELLAFPSEELANAIESGSLVTVIAANLRELRDDARLASPAFGPGKLSASGLEPEYIRLFDVPDRIPTPLYTGVYARRRRDAMEELLRIYRHFGLTVSGESHDLPDFVPTVLEFLQFLSRGIEEGTGAAREARERAMADVLERHLCPWAEQTLERLAKREALPFYRALVELVAVRAAARLRELRFLYPAGQRETQR